jgi:hypothetical protein
MNNKTDEYNPFDDEGTVETVEETVATVESEFDIDGLKADFPTAPELEKFVFEQTGITLALAGRKNELKYEVALDCLNGKAIDDKYISGKSMSRKAVDKGIPARDDRLPDRSECQNYFHSFAFPNPLKGKHPKVGSDDKVIIRFRKYFNGMISYEVEGPLKEVGVGEKQDAFGRIIFDYYEYVDPRSGEQLMRDTSPDSFTKRGAALATFLKSKRINKSNQFEVFVDREFASLNQRMIDDPWAEE